MRARAAIGLILAMCSGGWVGAVDELPVKEGAASGGDGERIMPPSEPAVVTLIVPEPALSIPYSSGVVDKVPTQASAARLLQKLITDATGLQPRIVSATNAPASGVRIYVGYGEHLEGTVTPPTAPEGLKVQEQESCFYLLGEIAPAGVNNVRRPMDRGVLHAVVAYAEQVLGYRFLFSPPDDERLYALGTVVPKLEMLPLPSGLLIEDAPVFTHRTTGSRPRRLIGLRDGSAPAFFCNHSYGMQWWSSTFGKSHPEMFIPKNIPKEGEAANDGLNVEALQPNLDWLDFTEPGVLEKRLEQIQAFYDRGKAGGFWYSPTQKYVVEEPPDGVAPSVTYNDRARALFDPNHHVWGNFSGIWFDYINRMAAEVKQRWPERRVSTLAYYRHYGVPTFPMADNVDVMLALMRTSTGNKEPDVFNANLEDVKKWSEHMGGDPARLFLWEYGCWPPGVLSPLMYPNAMQRWLKAVQPYVSGQFVELYDPLEYNYLMRYLWMKLLWNPEMDVQEAVADVCERFYGPAGETMTAFYERLIERYEMQWSNPKLQWGQYYTDDNLYFRQSYPPEQIDELATLMTRARRAVGLPAAGGKGLKRNAALYVANAGTARAPLQVSLTAEGAELVNPSVLWNGGRLWWEGRLQPGERLELSGDGNAAVIGTDGARQEVVQGSEGDEAALDAGRGCLLKFVEIGGSPKAAFGVEVRCGEDDTPIPLAGESDIYAQRMAWLSRAFQLLPAGRKGGDGFFVAANQVHQRMGLAAWAAKDRAASLIVEVNQALARAEALTGEENREARQREIVAARKQFEQLLSLDPEWKVREAQGSWDVIKKRGARARLWQKMGAFERARSEYEAAIPALPRGQKDARSYVYMLIGDLYAAEKDWNGAEAAYLKAQKAGLYGDRKAQVPRKLEQVRAARLKEEGLQAGEAGQAEPRKDL